MRASRPSCTCLPTPITSCSRKATRGCITWCKTGWRTISPWRPSKRRPSSAPHPEEARSAVSKDGGDHMLRDALLRNAPQHEADQAPDIDVVLFLFLSYKH